MLNFNRVSGRTLLRAMGIAGAVGMGFSASLCQAGVFDLPHFIPTDTWALGLEPEFNMNQGAGVGFNFKPTYGLTDLTNVTGIFGSGTGPERFRIGGNMTFDFFPDIDKQPGIGIAAQALYFRKPDAGQLDLTAIPYIHKTFMVGDNEKVEPFLAIPFGVGFSGGNYNGITTLAIGALFEKSPHLSYVTEFGISINNAFTYLSGGVVYYP